MGGPALVDRTQYGLLVDDGGDNLSGTNWNKTQIAGVVLDPIDALIAKLWSATICEGRLTLTAATPVTTVDVTAATTLRFALYKGNRIALYDGASVWNVRTFTELSIAVPATTSQMYDVWIFDNSGTPALELLAWTNDTTRATALTTQDGILVKTGATTRRYVGSFRTTTVSGQTEDSATKRYVWNYYNRVRRPLFRKETTSTWNYTTATWRQANASTANQVEAVIGLSEDLVELAVAGGAANTNANVGCGVSIGVNSTTTPATTVVVGGDFFSQVANIVIYAVATLRYCPNPGRNVYAWLEISAATGTTTWVGTLGQVGSNGLIGAVHG